MCFKAEFSWRMRCDVALKAFKVGIIGLDLAGIFVQSCHLASEVLESVISNIAGVRIIRTKIITHDITWFDIMQDVSAPQT